MVNVNEVIKAIRTRYEFEVESVNVNCGIAEVTYVGSEDRIVDCVNIDSLDTDGALNRICGAIERHLLTLAWSDDFFRRLDLDVTGISRKGNRIEIDGIVSYATYMDAVDPDNPFDDAGQVYGMEWIGGDDRDHQDILHLTINASDKKLIVYDYSAEDGTRFSDFERAEIAHRIYRKIVNRI